MWCCLLCRKRWFYLPVVQQQPLDIINSLVDRLQRRRELFVCLCSFKLYFSKQNLVIFFKGICKINKNSVFQAVVCNHRQICFSLTTQLRRRPCVIDGQGVSIKHWQPGTLYLTLLIKSYRCLLLRLLPLDTVKLILLKQNLAVEAFYLLKTISPPYSVKASCKQVEPHTDNPNCFRGHDVTLGRFAINALVRGEDG